MIPVQLRSRLPRWWSLLLSPLLVGCDLPQRPPLHSGAVGDGEAVNRRLTAAGESPETLEAPGIAFDGAWESWDVYFVKDLPVGYAHIKAARTGNRGQSDVRYEFESRLTLSQGPASLLQRITQVSTESSGGQLLGFEGVLRVGPATTRFSGSVADGELSVEIIRGTSRTQRRETWSPTYRGLLALEQSLRQRPLQSKGEERVLKMLVPGRYALATARLRCLGMAAVPLLDGALHELLEIHCETRMEGGSPAFSTIWTDESGEIVRTHSPSLQLVAYRTDQQTAMSLVGSGPLLVASIPVQGEIKTPTEIARVGYRIRPTASAKRAGVTPRVNAAPGQFVRVVENGEIQVLVSRRPETLSPGFSTAELQPTEADSAANYYIDFNDQRVRRFAALAIKAAAPSARDVAIELTRTVHQNVSDRPEGNGFAKASGVAEYWVADLNERAIFLAALLRERGIPARVALGLKYVSGEPARLAYHAWTLAYVDQEWIHLDPSEGGLAAADRIVISTTNLDNGDEFEALSPLLETMRLIEVEIVGQR